MTQDDTAIEQVGNAFFGFLGRYVFTLQWIEGMLDEIIRLEGGFENRSATNDRLAGMNLAAKINLIKPMMDSSERFQRAAALPHWDQRTDNLVHALHRSRERRNALVHSQYLFDFVEIGGPVYRANLMRRDGEIVVEGEDLFEPNMDGELMALYHLGFEVGQYKMQFIHLLEEPDG